MASFWLVQCYGRAIYTPHRAPPEPASLPSHCRSEAAWVRDIWPALGHTAMGLTFSFTLLLWAWGPFPGSRPQGRSVSNPENTGFCRLPTDPTLLPRGFLRRCLRCRFTCWHVLWAPDGTGHPVSKSNLHSVKKPLHPVSAVTPLSLPTTFPMLC